MEQQLVNELRLRDPQPLCRLTDEVHHPLVYARIQGRLAYRLTTVSPSRS